MSLRALSYLARISSCNAEIARMTAENVYLTFLGDRPAYLADSFDEQRATLDNINNEIQCAMQMGLQ